ncbi:hypothetical protein B0H13DRAFT_2346169 [Mycena leptocephala]|nr:hypothetical protein B0H13DRAFT_2346169 [Mycena leptocephala]
MDPTGAADLRIHAFENLEESAKDGIVDELLGQVGAVFSEVAKSQHPTQYSSNMSENHCTACCAMIVDLALSLTASHLASVLPTTHLLSLDFIT